MNFWELNLLESIKNNNWKFYFNILHVESTVFVHPLLLVFPSRIPGMQRSDNNMS